MLAFWQRLSGSQRISFLVILFLLVSIPTGVWLAQKTQIFHPKATSGPIDFYGTQVSFLKLFGQKSIGETSPGKITASGVFHSSGVVVDKSSTPNKVYVVDTGNNRILGFNGIDGDGTKPADMVFGQPSFTTGSCNGDNNLGINKAPTASTLCLIGYPYITNLGEYWMRANFDVDEQGNLYVVDVWNNRVLKYNQPYSADKSDGKGDNAADFVWGQDDFTSNGINKSSSGYYTSATPGPNKTSLWTSFGFGTTDHVAARGVSVDQQGNIWVADSFNHRILRFPPNSKDADLVLGQPDFTSNINGCRSSSTSSSAINAPLDRMCTPTLARVDPETGKLYVLDEHPPGFRARILVFNPTLRNGVAAGRIIIPEDSGFSSTGFIFNIFKQGDYATGKLWVNEHGLARTILIDDDGKIIKVIGTRGKDYIGGEHEIPSACGANSDFAKKNLWTGGGILDLWTPGGSIGFDSDNNIYLADDITDRVMRYALPYDPRTVNGQTCLPEPNGGLFPVKGPGMLGPNIKSDEALSGGIGVAIFGNQLIIENAGFRVWNNYLDKEVGSAPDIIVPSAGNSRKLMSDAIDDSNRLWVFNMDGKINVYQLPFEAGSENQPLASFVRLYWEDTGEEISYNGIDNAIAFDKFNKKIYLVDSPSHRVLRVSNYNVLFDGNSNNDKLFVDEVLGQIDKSTTGCNFYQQGVHFASSVTGPVRPDSLCKPHQVKFDKLGNLYVVENNYECQGNDRITFFTAEDLKNAQGLFPRLQAKKVFVGSLTGRGPCAYQTVDQPGSPVAIAFDSKNQMVVGNDGYYGTKEDRHLKQLWLYSDPLTRQTPDAYINLPMGASGELAFDAQDNLIVQDHTWSKVWIINLDRDPALVKWLRTVPTPSPVPSPSPYPSPSPASTPTPYPTFSPSPTPTPIFTPTPVPSPTPTIIPTPMPSPTPTTTPSAQSQTIELRSGFNMVGIRVDKPTEYRAENFLQEINNTLTNNASFDSVSTIYRYNVETQAWQVHTLGRTDDDNFLVTRGEGYFVYSEIDGTGSILGERRPNPQITIAQGWSLISLFTDHTWATAQRLLQSMQNQGINAQALARWNGQSYDVNYSSGEENYTMLRPGGAFWVYNSGEIKTFSPFEYLY